MVATNRILMPVLTPQDKLSVDHEGLLLRQCSEAIKRGVGYLTKAANYTEGGWSDFHTNSSGESTSWVTAHVLWHAGSVLPLDIAQSSLMALLTQKQEGLAWGFSSSVPPDCDSTLHALHALRTLDAGPQDLSASVRFVLAHQTEDGGFSTYKDGLSLIKYRGEGKGISYDGWTQSHVCVTAVALETLPFYPELVSQQVLEQATDFLLKNQSPEGYWESYWWRSKYFATSRIIIELHKADKREVVAGVSSALTWLIDSFNRRGFWPDSYDQTVGCPLSTALCINTLSTVRVREDLIQKAVSWLLGRQSADGSWQGLPSLQIPPPNVHNPADFDGWRLGGRGVGSCCVDEKRTYTTATVVGALHRSLGLLEEAK